MQLLTLPYALVGVGFIKLVVDVDDILLNQRIEEGLFNELTRSIVYSRICFFLYMIHQRI